MKISYLLIILWVASILTLIYGYETEIAEAKDKSFSAGFKSGTFWQKYQSPKYINLPEEISISDNNQKLIATVHDDTLFVEYPTGSIFQRTGDTIIIKY